MKTGYVGYRFIFSLAIYFLFHGAALFVVYNTF